MLLFIFLLGAVGCVNMNKQCPAMFYTSYCNIQVAVVYGGSNKMNENMSVCVCVVCRVC